MSKNEPLIAASAVTALQFVDRGGRKILQMKTVPLVMKLETGLEWVDKESDWQDVPLVDDEDTEKHKPLQGH